MEQILVYSLLFLVSIICHILLKLTTLLRVKNQYVSTVIVFFISIGIYYCSCYVYPLPQDMIFSIHCIPEYLFCYALGSTLYNIYSKFPAFFKHFLRFVLLMAPVAYMLAAYFGYVDRLWSWVYLYPANPLYLLPEAVRTVMAFLFTRTLSKIFASSVLANIGKSTLILCCSEAVMKTTVWLIADVFGLSTNVTNPIQSLCFSIFVMFIAMHTVVPVTNLWTQKINAFLLAHSARWTAA